MKQSFILSLVVVILPIITSCESSHKNQAKTLRVGINGDININSPLNEKNRAEWFLFHFLHGTLINTDTTHAFLTASLAKDWLINTDSSRYIIYLHDNLFFSPHSIFNEKKTRTVTALDVVGSIKFYIANCKEKRMSPIPFENLRGIEHFYDLCSISNFLTIPLDGVLFSDEQTLVFEFYEPNKRFFEILSDLSFPIIPYECLSDGCSAIPGFGFYRIEKNEPNHLIVAVVPEVRDLVKYEKIEILSNLTYERLNQFLTEGAIDLAIDLHTDFINLFLESNIERIRKAEPDFYIFPLSKNSTTFAAVSSMVDSSIWLILKKLP